MGILRNTAQGSQEQPRKLQEQPPEHPGVARMSSWLHLGLLANMANKGSCRIKGSERRVLLYNTLTCVGGKGDALYYVVWAVGLNPSLTLS